MTALLAHRLAGEGDVVLLLNGGMMSLSSWDEIAGPLEASYRLLRCDLRGQLLSPGPVPPTLAGQAEELVALLDALAIDRVHAVGASFGAEVGLLLAALHPSRVRSLVAITATDRMTPAMRAGARSLRAACRRVREGGDRGAVFDEMVPGTFAPSYQEANRGILAERRRQIALLPDAWFEGLEALLAALEECDPRPHLPRIACPVLVVGGELDRIFPLEHSRALAAAIAGAELAVVEGAAHGLIVEKPGELLGLIRGFLARVAPPATGRGRGAPPREGGRP